MDGVQFISDRTAAVSFLPMMGEQLLSYSAEKADLLLDLMLPGMDG
ncbi:MAG: hypothetical protein WBK18_06080 [Thermacetogeniaceae bacterium]|jgi:CheY-like chemotaxis protein